MIKINAIGDVCPIPVIKVKDAIKELNGKGVIEITVDNEIAVQNLTKMAQQKIFKFLLKRNHKKNMLLLLLFQKMTIQT